jgi:hypothetical protein
MQLSELTYEPRELQEGEEHTFVILTDMADCNVDKLFTMFKEPVIIERGVLPQLKTYAKIAERKPYVYQETKLSNRESLLTKKYI